MFEKQEFIASAFNFSQIPKERLPEVVLCGRSNAGKSSFINSFFNNKSLAKISSSPGKTRSINYYKINNKFYIVDLPGYGYAKVSKTEREKWGKLINEFFNNSGHIVLAIHFIDCRHKPTELDIQLNNFLKELDIPYIVLLNKIDKLKQSEISPAKKNIKIFFPELSDNDNLMIYSAIKKTGKKEMLKRFSSLFL